MDVILGPLLRVTVTVIDLYVWIILAEVILSWLISFNVVNTSNRFVYMVADFIHRLTEPALGRVRRFIPNLGGFDLSPIILIFGLILIQDVLIQILGKVV